MSGLAARALALFDEYVEWSPARRKRALAELATRDPALHKALSALLESDASDRRSVLDKPAANVVANKQQSATRDGRDDDAPDPRIGTRLGAWRVRRLIANGGMGTVYEAHRDDAQYRQRVALKCIRAELISPALVDALRDERNLLARLDHPGIATLLDGGVDDGGHPWFAMRFVDGIPIDTWCDERRIGISERVSLLLQACEALAHAHAQGILHQDIKPSNLLVTPEGRVQMVDFGIASTFSLHETDPQPCLALSADYCAPEAHDRGTNGPGSDLYSLGVLGYRLLCGQWPTPLHGVRSIAPLAQLSEPLPMPALLDDVPESTASARGLRTRAALRRTLSGDLSAIMLKAVASKPQERYASVNEFAADLRRWRSRLPISIREDEGLYRLGKFLRRNLLVVAVTTLMLGALTAGVGIAWQQHNAAVREANATMLVNQLFASTLGTATLSGLGSTPFSSSELLERTERELRQLPLSEHPAALARGLATLARSHALLGKYRHAAELADEAHRTMGDLPDKDGFISATRISMLNNHGDNAEAAKLARDRLREIEGEDDEQGLLMRLTFGTELAKAQWGLGQTTDAIETINGLVEQASALPPGHDEQIAELLIARSDLLSQMWRYPGAEADARKAMSLARPLNPVLSDNALELLVAILGSQYDPDTHKYAMELKQRRQASLGASHPQTAKATIYAAWTQYPRVDADSVRQALEQIRVAYGDDNPQYADALSSSAWAVAHDRRESIELGRQSLSIQQRVLGDKAAWTMIAKANLANSLIALDRDERHPEDIEEAIRLLWETIQAKQNAGIPAPIERQLLLKTMVNEGDTSKLSQVDALIERGRQETLESTGDQDGEDSLRLQIFDQLGARLRYLAGEREKADALFAAIIEKYRDLLEHPTRAVPSQAQTTSLMITQSLLYRALYAFESCHPDLAKGFLQQGYAFSQSTLGDEDNATRTIKSYLDNMNDHGLMVDDTGALWISVSENQAVNERAAACGNAAFASSESH
ncbi:serine/threonine-protein kinase [Marilutibacter maris]|uniref:Serine/threonine protein kinase n=1 Tax=Marilutibacter maris TaxID=1605891 RepID=A0A2U9T2J3_9GAMM|nr:serine/threonine-protein kinase [Lysobacter maris]AWV06703.1 serine/threonine protein kinase [Lysobacter maris]